MTSPMPDVSDDEWRQVDLDHTRDECPLGEGPFTGRAPAYEAFDCGVFYDDQGVKGCTMAGIASGCVWK